MKSVLLVAVFTSVVVGGLGAKILAMLPFFGKSHHIFTSAVLKSLVERGHHVVEYGPNPSFKPSENYTHIEIHTSFETTIKNWHYSDIVTKSRLNKYTLGLRFLTLWGMTYQVCEETFKQESVKQLLNSNEHFDLVITESTFGQESMVVFGHKFKAPLVTLQGFSTVSGVNMDAGNSLLIATIPDFGSIVSTDQMTFMERLLNLVSNVIALTAYYKYELPKHDRLVRQHYHDNFPPLKDMVNNISLYLVDSHPAIEYVRPYTPNIIPIGGISISQERTTLPENIQTFMDEATDGVIYFSLGTVVPAHVMPQEVLQIYVNVFKRLKQKVLWKIDLETIPNLPTNVLITKWVPQPGVLAHPNCVIFMTHCGQFSQQEALYAGVPTVGIPFFGDQPFNARLSEHRGFGVKLDFTSVTEETLYTALTSVLNDPKYKENARRLSRIYRDRPMSPTGSVVFWVEYVIRHGGAHQLRPASAHLSWYQLALLDVIAVIFVAFLTTLLATYVVLRTLFSFIFMKRIRICSRKKSN